MQKFRRGDIVSARGVVQIDQHDDDDTAYVVVAGNHISVKVDALTLVRPFFAAGDTAYLEGVEVVVIGTHEDFVWIMDGADSTNVVLATDLKRSVETGAGV